ncbi:MAG: O-antigen ligase family protein [Gallionella sp.]|nr:O-antigen ligase family protein [Gallionella sp.]
MTQASVSRTRGQLWALFALIVYTPLPLASNRPWALALLGLLTGGLLLWTIWRPGGRLTELAWQGAKTPLILLGLWMALLVVQLIPMPGAWLAALDQSVINSFASQGEGVVSIDSYSTRLYLAKACILSAVFWLVLVLIDSKRRIEWLAMVIVFSGLLQALIGVMLMATGANFQLFFVEISQPRAHGTFVSPNNFAGYLELTLAVGIGLMIAKLDGLPVANWRQRVQGWLALLISEKALLRLSLIIMVVGLVASRSRMGNAAFFASLIIVGFFTIVFAKHVTQRTHDRQEKNTLRATIVFIVSLIVLDVFIIGGVVGVEKVVQRLENTNLHAQSALVQLQGMPGKDAQASMGIKPIEVRRYEQSVEERGEAVIPSLQIVRDFPWLGTGGGTFHLSFPHYRPSEVVGFYDHPHNDYVEFASEVGLLGLLLLALMVAHSVWSSVMLLVRSHDQLARGMAFASLMGVTSLLIHAAVDFNFQIPANAMLFLIVLSLPYLFVKLKH